MQNDYTLEKLAQQKMEEYMREAERERAVRLLTGALERSTRIMQTLTHALEQATGGPNRPDLSGSWGRSADRPGSSRVDPRGRHTHDGTHASEMPGL